MTGNLMPSTTKKIEVMQLETNHEFALRRSKELNVSYETADQIRKTATGVANIIVNMVLPLCKRNGRRETSNQ